MLSPFEQAIEDLDKPEPRSDLVKRKRKLSKTEELTLWFWKEKLHHTEGAYTNPSFWRYMAEAKRLLNPIDKNGHNYDIQVVKDAIEMVEQDKGAVTTMTCVDWINGEKTYYELALDPESDMPPIWDPLAVRWWQEKHNARAVSGSAG